LDSCNSGKECGRGQAGENSKGVCGGEEETSGQQGPVLQVEKKQERRRLDHSPSNPREREGGMLDPNVDGPNSGREGDREKKKWQGADLEKRSANKTIHAVARQLDTS